MPKGVFKSGSIEYADMFLLHTDEAVFLKFREYSAHSFKFQAEKTAYFLSSHSEMKLGWRVASGNKPLR